MSVVFINLFEVPVGRDETFRGLWQQVEQGIPALVPGHAMGPLR